MTSWPAKQNRTQTPSFDVSPGPSHTPPGGELIHYRLHVLHSKSLGPLSDLGIRVYRAQKRLAGKSR